MSKSLKTLDRIQKFKIDEQRKILAEKLTREENIINQINQLDKKYNQEKIFAQANPNLCDFGIYTKHYLDLRHEEENSLRQVQEEIESIRGVISDLFKEQKTYEIVNRNRELQNRKDSEQKEQKMLDEIGTNNYIKHHKQ